MTVVYRAQAEGTGEEVTKAAASLEAVITKHQQYIESTTKGPIMSFSSKYDLSKPITKEEQKVHPTPSQCSQSKGCVLRYSEACTFSSGFLCPCAKDQV